MAYKHLSAVEIAQIKEHRRLFPTRSIRQLAAVFRRSRATVKRALSFSGDKVRRRASVRSPTPSVKRRRAVVRALAMKVRVIGGVKHPLFPSAPSMATELGRRGIHVNPSTVHRDLTALGFVSRVRPRAPTRDPLTLRRRELFAKKLVRAGKNNFSQIVFTDEHMGSANDYSDRRQYVCKGKEPLRRLRTSAWNVARLHVWGAIGIGYKSRLVFLPESRPAGDDDNSKSGRVDVRMNGTLYKRLCLTPVVPSLVAQRRTLMQDGARCHWRGDVIQYLQRKRVRFINDWPPHSPDLNPIEKVWAVMKLRVGRLHVATKGELRSAMQQVWDGLSQAEVDRICWGAWGRAVRVGNGGGEVY